MDSYEILESIHKVGHPISGIVKGFKKSEPLPGNIFCDIELETNTQYKSILPFYNLFDEVKPFEEELLPGIGTEIRAVVENHSGDTLYLSAKPSDLAEEQIESYRQFYHYVEYIELGTIRKGKIAEIRPFGIFVDLSLPFMGLIEIGHNNFNSGEPLPYDNALWPKKGDPITCVINYFRLHNRQFGLGWLPDV